MEIPSHARVCPYCTRDIIYVNHAGFDGIDMLKFLIVAGIVMKACEWMGCQVR
jgi:hypothetical protein